MILQLKDSLNQHGVSGLGLKFCIDASSRTAAEDLAALIRKRTDYEVEFEKVFFRRKWRITATTENTISAEELDQRVMFMHGASKEYSCKLVSVSIDYNVFAGGRFE